MTTARQRGIDAKLRKSGRVATIRRTNVAGKVTTYEAPCLFLSGAPQGDTAAVGGFSQDLVAYTAYRVMLSPLVKVKPDPETDEILAPDGKTWLKVVSCIEEQPAKELLYYNLIARV